MPTIGMTYNKKLAEYFACKNYFLESFGAHKSHERKLPQISRTVNIRKVFELPWQRLILKNWSEVEKLFTDLFFLESKVECGRVLDLTEDFDAAVAILPKDRPHYKILCLLVGAIRQDTRFIINHPETLFQCLWNSCWWYDCPEAKNHYEDINNHQVDNVKTYPWQQRGLKLYELLEAWKLKKEIFDPDYIWIRSLRPSFVLFGSCRNLECRGHIGAVLGISFSNSGKLASCCGASGNLMSVDAWAAKIWDPIQGIEIISMLHPSGVKSICFFNDDTLIATGSNDGNIRIFEANNGHELICLFNSYSPINDLVVTPDGRYIAVGSVDGMIKIWNSKLGECKYQIHAHNNYIQNLIYTSEGKLLSSSRDNTVKLWSEDLSRREFSLTFSEELISIGYDEHENQIGVVTANGLLIFYDVFSQKQVSVRQLNVKPSRAVFSHFSHYLAIGTYDGRVSLYNYTNGDQLAQFYGHEDSISSLAFSHDDKRLASGSWDESVRVWDLGALEKSYELKFPKHSDQVAMMQLSPNGLNIMSKPFIGEVLLWNFQNGRPLGKMNGSIMSRTPQYRPNSWRAIQKVEETEFRIPNSELPLVYFPRRLDILFPHPFGNLFAGALGKEIFLIKIEGLKEKESRALDDLNNEKLEAQKIQLKGLLSVAKINEDFHQFFQLCEPFIELCLTLEDFSPIGELLDECGRFMIKEKDYHNALFFYRQAEEIWRLIEDDLRLNKNLQYQNDLIS
jgi:WD40 repeat protein